VGAIEAREREKKEIRDGVSSQMVQHAIMQRRQQEAQAMQYGQAYQGGAVYGQSQGPHPQQQQQQQQQQWNPPHGHLAAAWSSPAVGNPSQVQYQQPYPQQYQQQQQPQQPRVSYYGHGQQNPNSQGYQ
jgi:CCR4-NOT transcriptional complex subunit CAF120